jgi:purine-cytosine permease-like protein
MASQPKVMEIEQQGIDTISDRDRTSTPKDLFRITFGGANTFATIILGTFPILLGLSFWQAVAATLLGVVVGASILMPMSLFGPVTGTNNAVSSGAHFGVKGRLVGSFLSLSNSDCVLFNFCVGKWGCITRSYLKIFWSRYIFSII